MLKANEIRKMSVEDLKAKREDLSVDIFKLRVQSNSGNSKNAGLVKNMRHDIARINTILKEKTTLNEGVNND